MYASLSSVSNLRCFSFHTILGPSVADAVVADAAAISSLVSDFVCYVLFMCLCFWRFWSSRLCGSLILDGKTRL
jgi:hypothetical protein